MNEWINDEAVCITAPATPGLLNIMCGILGTKEPAWNECGSVHKGKEWGRGRGDDWANSDYCNPLGRMIGGSLDL